MSNIISLDKKRREKLDKLFGGPMTDLEGRIYDPCDHEDLKLTIHEGDTFWTCPICGQFTDIHGQVIGHER